MRKIPQFIGIHADPKPRWQWMLGMIPFVLFIGSYLVSSHARNIENPYDKLLPTVSKMADASYRLAFVKERRTERYILLDDTISSMRRFSIGMALASLLGLLMGLNMGVFRGFRSLFLPSIQFLALIPPLALLSVLLVYMGIGESSKNFLIFIGIFPVIAYDIYLTVYKIPNEVKTKALTLGASQLAIVYRIILPQIMPRLIENLVISVGPAWTFLIASEMIASSSGLGYEILMAQRNNSMDKVIPLVIFVTLLGYLMKFGLNLWLKTGYRWYLAGKE